MGGPLLVSSTLGSAPRLVRPPAAGRVGVARVPPDDSYKSE
ncbi:hypothetical protein HMPREF0591_0789 [Mycobacterium parascrofulaceum ATCC BAA-614]|uniref:Uncharacterized protein n=1 Tax=Mycobacterium parascrofulaceum ATCC BAA-614 TaxID=525368 RepID=D5P3P5_9MYCO|nr:hypothetical protein HMPREF0591_0789 [Mycobacterium parascrofulaceum ATCC BAA-614]